MSWETLAIAAGPFLITFRESLEAALIIVIIAAYLDKSGKAALKRYLYSGAGAAIILSMSIGIAVNAFYGGLLGAAEQLFEGIAAITAASVLTYMIFWMGKNAHRIRDELHGKVSVAITKSNMIGIAAIAFIAVFREGIETVLFLTAIAMQEPLATTIGTTAGFASVLFLSVVMSREMHRLNIKKLFDYSSLLLLVFAAGLLGYGVHEFIEAGEGTIELGVLSEHAFDINPADETSPLHEKGVIGSIARALIGYDGNPEWLRVIAYLGYWFVAGIYLARTRMTAGRK